MHIRPYLSTFRCNCNLFGYGNLENKTDCSEDLDSQSGQFIILYWHFCIWYEIWPQYNREEHATCQKLKKHIFGEHVCTCYELIRCHMIWELFHMQSLQQNWNQIIQLILLWSFPPKQNLHIRWWKDNFVLIILFYFWRGWYNVCNICNRIWIQKSIG